MKKLIPVNQYAVDNLDQKPKYLLEEVQPIAEDILKQLRPHCHKCQIVGSVRRGKNLKAHLFHGADEIAENLTTAKVLAKTDKVELLVRAERPNKTSTDAKLNGTKADFKVSSGSRSSVQSAVKQASRQEAKIVVLRLQPEASSETVLNSLKGALSPERNRNIAEVWIVINGKVLKTRRFVTESFRKEVIKRYKKQEGS